MADVVMSPATRWLDDESLIERILHHLDRGTTDLADDTWREPVKNYRLADRLDREVGLVLRQLPIPFCPSAAVPDPGAYLARVAAGVPIVVVRDREGRVRAFRNTCRHRGTTVVSGNGCARSFACPYHGWVYGLDGALRHVPDEYGFPGLDRATRGLVPVEAAERSGLVWVAQDGALDPVRLPTASTTLIGPDQVLLDTADVVLDANWKVLTEGFLEGYHIKATHRATFLPFGYDNVNVVEHNGRDSRITFPFRRIESLRDLPAGNRDISGKVTIVCHLFPNVIIARLSHHTTMVVIEPISVDQSRQVMYQLTNRQPDERTTGDTARDTEFVKTGAIEDLAAALSVQRGLMSGANEYLEFGRFEGAITHFHRQLTELVGT